MKPKLKPIFMIFVVLVSLGVVSEGVVGAWVGACQGDVTDPCNYEEPTCTPTEACYWGGIYDYEEDDHFEGCIPKRCGVWDYDYSTCISIDGCDWEGDCIPDITPPQDCPKQQGVCAGAQETCKPKGFWLGCDDEFYTQYASQKGLTYQYPSETSCDGYDNDCDGQEDEGCEYKGDGSKAVGRCVVRDNCETGEHFIISLSDPPYNAHASSDEWGVSRNNICCNISGFESISTENRGYNACDRDGHIISLSSMNNAHGSTYWRGYYGYEVCLTTDLYVDLDCQVTSSDCNTLGESYKSYFCMFSLAGEEDGEYINNAHFGKCDSEDYDDRVCCSVKGGLAINDVCSEDEECFAWDERGDGKGHCVQYNLEGETRCQPLDPWAGDMYCDGDFINEIRELEPEDVEKATRETDVASCAPDPVCQYMACSGGCNALPLPAGEYSVENPKVFLEEEAEGYPYLVAGETYPYYTATWECNEFNSNEEGGEGMHCDGEGNCVTSCIDEDEDGYGLSSETGLIYPKACEMGSLDFDCNDNATDETAFFVNPGSLSPFCDCDPNTPDWFESGVIRGIDEGPINIHISIEEDLCFDGEDNDCDSEDGITHNIDCSDLDCSPNGYLSPIRNRTCGVNKEGESDCTKDDQLKINYQTEPDNDRACCPDPHYCVIDGECVASGDLHGEFPNVHQCTMGKWYGGDTWKAVCNVVVNDTNLENEHWGLTGNAGNGACCGDDLNEYYTKGAYASYACCDKPDMQVIGGKCVGSLTEVHTWDKTSSGYCLDDTQCLVNPNEVDFDKTVEDVTSISHYPLNKVRCINNGEFIGDHYCRNGEWTSRTALLIRQLMDIAGNSTDYSLFCDSYDNVLNFYGYVINEWYPAVNYLQTGEFQCEIGKGNVVPCVNNICILQYEGDKVVIGASINHDVDASSYSILEALGGTNRDCSSVLDSNTFEVCGGGLYYNNKIKSILYSRTELTISDVLTGGEAAYIRNLFEPTLYYLQYNTPPSYDYGFVNETHDFNKIFLNKKGDKTIYIITEEVKNKKYMSATYSNFDTNICAMIENYKLNNPVLVPFDCVKQGNVNYVFTGGLTQGYYELLNDLGPKLRIK